MKNQRNPKAVEIGERITEARRENGMTQRELADLLGLSERSVAAYEIGEVIPYRYVKDLERALGRPAAWFLHGEDAIIGRDEQLSEILAAVRQNLAAINALEADVMQELRLLRASCDGHFSSR